MVTAESQRRCDMSWTQRNGSATRRFEDGYGAEGEILLRVGYCEIRRRRSQPDRMSIPITTISVRMMM